MAHLEFGDWRLQQLLRAQDGVVARRQLRELGADDGDTARMLRRRELTSRHPGVYVNHTGPLTPRQRQWVAVLAAWPAALTGESVLGEVRSATIQVAVAHGRTVQGPPWAAIERMTQLEQRVRWQASPPAVRIEHALIDAMSKDLRSDDVAKAYARLTDVAHSRRTTIDRIEAALHGRERVAGRRTILAMLDDLRTGANSVLERGYLHRIERAHGLPQPRRQHVSTATGHRTKQDIRYEEYGLVIETDGRAFHEGAAALDQDAARDLAELAMSTVATARVTYGLVFTHSCRTARWIAAILRNGGWRGDVKRCPHCP